ncbi:MAG: hypothetical protein HFJ20_04585 [Clostridia bacterium]|nr:hypothetical protein [Clostridia bacterium]
MICKNCNKDNNDEAKFCVGCGAKLEESQVIIENTSNNQSSNNVSEVPEYKPTSAIIAIVVSFLCCGGIIGGIFAILSLVEGSKVKTFVEQGNIVAANASLAQAKKWNKISWIIIAVFAVLLFIWAIFILGIAILEAL